jgi:hypothetical protein
MATPNVPNPAPATKSASGKTNAPIVNKDAGAPLKEGRKDDRKDGSKDNMKAMPKDDSKTHTNPAKKV